MNDDTNTIERVVVLYVKRHYRLSAWLFRLPPSLPTPAVPFASLPMPAVAFASLAAFSCFSFCEYGIMLTNVAYHYTGTTDLEDFNWYFARPAAIANSPHSNGVRHKAD